MFRVQRGVIERVSERHITPGLSTFSNEPDKASEYMRPLMQFIVASIPRDRHIDTPVHFMATAGMRLLDGKTQKKILNDITNDLRSEFGIPRIRGQVISGTQEAIFSWLSLNAASRLVSQNTTITYGMIELGGASAQVAFELNPTIRSQVNSGLFDERSKITFEKEQGSVILGPNNKIRLFSTSFLGLGVNSARETAIDLLVMDYFKGIGGLDNSSNKSTSDTTELRIFDPCLNRGAREIVSRPHSPDPKLASHGNIHNIILEGIGNFYDCISLSERTIKYIKSEMLNCKDTSHCPLHLLATRFIPFDRMTFIGLSEMFFTTNEMLNLSGIFDRAKMLHGTKEICNTQFTRLQEQHEHDLSITHKDRILYECSKACWLLTLLHNQGFMMPSDYGNLNNVDRFQDRAIDWTVGAMMTLS